MYTFTFYYDDGNSYSVKNIIKVQYLSNSGSIKTLSEAEILSYCFSFSPSEMAYYLFALDKNYSFSSKQLRHIAVEKEN